MGRAVSALRGRGAARTRLPYPEAARSLLRSTIVDAVDALVRSRGWSATTMSDVATASGVSRQTVYNEFGSRQTLVEAYVLREIDALLREVEDGIRSSADDPHGAMHRAFELFLNLASDEPLVKVIVSDAGGGELMRLLTGLGRNVATERIGRLIVEVWPHVSLPDAALLAESMARLAISHALLPTSDAQRTAADVSRMVSPFIEQILGD